MLGCWLAIVAGVLLVRAPTPAFLYDAAVYWTGALTLVTGGDVVAAAALDVRGVLTPGAYAPAALLHHRFAVDPAMAVLVQNAVMIGVLGAVVLPLLVGRLTALRPVHVVACAALIALTLSGFAPHPLMDVPALLLVSVGALAITSRRCWALLPGGAALAAAVVLRPAYALPAILVVLAVAALGWRGWRGVRAAALTALGTALALGAQVLHGWRESRVVSVLPADSDRITDVQLRYAAYGVRYDTVTSGGGDPRLWHCSPDMARAAVDHLPDSNGELFSLYLSSLPDSAVLALHKVAGTLQWSWSTPHADPGSQAMLPLGILVTALVCAGGAALVAFVGSDRSNGASARPRTAVTLLALAVGVMVTTVGSAPEARFAAPLLAVGIVGCVATLGSWRTPGRETDRLDTRGGAAALVLTGVVLALGGQALADPLPPGDLTPEVCIATGAGAA